MHPPRYVVEDILAEALRRVPGTRAAKTCPDPGHTVMRRLGRDALPTQPGLIRELATARDYATYVSERHGEVFVHASRFRDAFVPVFDGFVPDGPVPRNVSFKYDALARTTPSLPALLKSLRARLDVRLELRKTTSLHRWLAAVNLWAPSVRGVQTVRDLERDLDRALTLWVTFGLDQSLTPRPLCTVVDLRSSGFTFAWVTGPKVRDAIREISPPGGLTLLWDRARVLEF